MNHSRRLDILVTPGFLFGLFVLLLNDFALKSLFHNWFTGKLSDFAGLFIFPLFWSALFFNAKRLIYPLTACCFVFWKSHYSQPLIDAWNDVGFLQIARTIDYSDLIALLILPLSYLYAQIENQNARARYAPYVISIVALFAFTATQRATDHFTYHKQYEFQVSKEVLLKRLQDLELLRYGTAGRGCEPPNCPAMEFFSIQLRSDLCKAGIDAQFNMYEERGRGIINLTRISTRCDEGRSNSEQLLQLFEREYLEKIKNTGASYRAISRALQLIEPDSQSCVYLFC